MPLTELVAAGNVGLMRALARFEPERGFRFASYAMWWVRAAIREHVLRNRWLVTIGTTTARKKLVFNLRRLKRASAASSARAISRRAITGIAQKLEVSEDEVIEMNRRLGASMSLPFGLCRRPHRRDSDG